MSKEEFDTVIQSVEETSLAYATRLLQGGEVVAVPTETVYGLAADATNSSAVSEIYAAKGRPSFNPLIVHVGLGMKEISALVRAGVVDDSCWTKAARAATQLLMDLFWPGPLTLVMPRGEKIVDEAAGGLDTVAVRMPGHPVFLELIERVGAPLAAPSANRSKRMSPTTARHVFSELAGRIPLILDGGPASVGVESTIIAVQPSGRLQLLRPGGIPREKIAERSGLVFDDDQGTDHAAPIAPGMMLEHYAPSKPLILASRAEGGHLARWVSQYLPEHEEHAHKTIGVLLFSEYSEVPPAWMSVLGDVVYTKVNLSGSPDGEEAARQLFSALRLLDESSVEWIVAEYPEQPGGLWLAIRDRLTRAAARWRLDESE